MGSREAEPPPPVCCSSQLFLLLPLVEAAARASETLEIPATMVAIFFLLAESETLIPPDNLLPGETDALLGLGEGCSFLPVGEACRYLDGTMMAASLDVLRFSSRAAIRLGTTHFDGCGEADRFPLPAVAGDGSLFADDRDRRDFGLSAAAGDENRRGLSETLTVDFVCDESSSTFSKLGLGARTRLVLGGSLVVVVVLE